MTLTAIQTKTDGRPVFVLRPDWSQPARSAIDLLAAVARARSTGGTVCLLPDTNHPLRISLDNTPVIAADGRQAAWLSLVWRTASAMRELRERWRDKTVSAGHEWRRELRRQAADERLPFELRQRLRTVADMSARYTRAEIERFPRRLLRAPSTVSVSAAPLDQAWMELKERGVTDGTPLVTFESRTRPDVTAAAIDYLRRDGYMVVDPTTLRARSPLLDVFLVSTSTFIVCESSALQQLAYLTNTPSLMINAREPFVAYPVRANGLFALCTAIDLEAGRVITIGDMLTEPYFRDLRKQEARGRRRGSYGYRDNTTEELIEALNEIKAGIGCGWTNETESQSRFRARVVDAGAALAAVSPHVAEWGPDDGFIGDGRLVQFQADRVP